MNRLTSPRIASIDLLRGAIMIIMALDHVRDYFSAESFQHDPLDLQKASTAIFFTRWITHFCAPVFMLLAGVSASITGRRRTKNELSFFLLMRGLWLILLEMTVLNFGWNFNIHFTGFLFIVIWALGVSMICLAAFIHLPKKLILLLGLIIVAGHNLLDGIQVRGNSPEAFGWALLHQQNQFTWQGETILVLYPLLPWIGVMALGYCLGDLYAPDYASVIRRRHLRTMGISAIVVFIVLRLINVYGDPSPWSMQQNSLRTLMSFIRVAKYPPSLLYLLMTLGPALIFLSYTEKAAGNFVRIISVYGRVPMFYYVVHIFLLHGLAMVIYELFTPLSWREWILEKPLIFGDALKTSGFSLSVVYLVWVFIVISLYPLCRWYDQYKRTHKEKWWLSYL